MGDIRRAHLTRLVYSRLRDETFRRLLKAAAPGGEHPVVVALRDDPLSDLVRRIHVVGGSASVVVSDLVDVIDDPDKLTVVLVDVRAKPAFPAWRLSSDLARTLRGDCTVGVFLERLQLDARHGGAMSYMFVLQRSGAGQCDKAEVISIGESGADSDKTVRC